MKGYKEAKSLQRLCGKARAFTLVELLVVIAIIALLVSILLPVLAKAKEQAMISVCASQLKQIGLALNMYADDNDQWTPPLRPYQGDPEDVRYGYSPWADNEKWGLGRLIPQYMDSARAGKILYCPAQRDQLHSFDEFDPLVHFQTLWENTIGKTVVTGVFARRTVNLDSPVTRPYSSGGKPQPIYGIVALVSDLFHAGHVYTGHIPYGENVAYSDTSVHWLMQPDWWQLKAETDPAYPQHKHQIERVWEWFDEQL